MITGQEVHEIEVVVSGAKVCLCLVREVESDLLFAVDGSYVEQGAGVVISPYGHGTVCFTDDGSCIEDGSASAPDVLAARYGSWREHPDYPWRDWVYQVSNGDTHAGYWEWVSSNIQQAEHERAQLVAQVHTPRQPEQNPPPTAAREPD